MVEPYTWDEIKGVLSKELKKTRHIMTFGTIGSLNVKHDIDTIITKKPRSRSADFFKEIHKLFDNVDRYLNKKYGARAIRFSRFSHEEEVKYIASFKKNDLAFHVMAYISLDQIFLHWSYDLRMSERYAGVKVNKKVINELKKSYSCILGSLDDLFKPSFKSNKKGDAFILLNDLDRINSHFPEKFLVFRMNVFFDHMFRKMLEMEVPKAKNKKEVRKIFYKMCDAIDKYRG